MTIRRITLFCILATAAVASADDHPFTETLRFTDALAADGTLAIENITTEHSPA